MTSWRFAHSAQKITNYCQTTEPCTLRRKQNIYHLKSKGKSHAYEIPNAPIFHISSHCNVVAQLSQAKEGSSLYLRAFLVLKVHFSPQLAAAIWLLVSDSVAKSLHRTTCSLQNRAFDSSILANVLLGNLRLPVYWLLDWTNFSMKYSIRWKLNH